MIDKSFKTFKDINIKNNNQINNNQTNQNINNNQKNFVNNNNNTLKNEISECEGTIDNVNSNNDISIKINQKYDDKILNQNAGFVLGKNGKNDE